MQKRIFYIIFTLATLCFSECGEYKDNNNDETEVTASDFAMAYFNYDFSKAATLATDDSRKWLEFEASNITDGDIQTLRDAEEGAIVEVNSSTTEGDEATVEMTVKNYLYTDAIGKPGRMVEGKVITVKLKKQADGKWKVRMEAPLRSGK